MQKTPQQMETHMFGDKKKAEMDKTFEGKSNLGQKKGRQNGDKNNAPENLEAPSADVVRCVPQKSRRPHAADVFQAQKS